MTVMKIKVKVIVAPIIIITWQNSQNIDCIIGTHVPSTYCNMD